MSLTYTTYVTALASLAVESTPPSTEFTTVLPNAIDYAEQRLYRELDLLTTVTRDSSANATANSRTFTLPSSIGQFKVVEAVNIITPVGSSLPSGSRTPLLPASKEYLDFIWPQEAAASATTVPQYFAMLTDQSILFGPPPGAAFNVEIIGTVRPQPLSATNTQTFLSLNLPDLFLVASMIFISGWQKSFGQQSDNPQLAQSWETQYGLLMASADKEEQRKKFAGASWTSKGVMPSAQPQRG